MIEKIIEASCRNKFLVIAAWIGVAVAGWRVLLSTPVDAIPDLSENQVIVFTDWMGRSPREIEDQITYPLSVNLQGLAGIKTVRSSSEFNFSMINLIFDDSVDFYFARQRVIERLALANTFLPAGVTPYMAPDATALGQVFWYSVEGDGVDAGTLRAIQDWLVRYQLNSVPGVAQVASVGGFPREYQVDVLPDRLRAYQITLGQLFDAIMRSNSAAGGRVIQKGNAEYLIRGVGWIRSIEDLRASVIEQRGGVPIRVGDVAIVQTGSEFRRGVLEKDGREITGGVVLMRFGENPREVIQNVQKKIRELSRGLPKGVRIVPFYDRTILINKAVSTIRTVLEHEIIIAAIAILLILTHIRSVFIVITTLPLSILAAFILMRLNGISSNIMSLSGIAISIGILVDQSIVMLENATHRLTQRFGDQLIQGDTTDITVEAMKQVGRPIFFSVMIMVISFLPVFALTGQEGKLFHPLAWTKTFALIGTALISITLVPALIPLLVRGKLSHEQNNWIIRSVTEMYRPVLKFLLRRPKTVIWLFTILLAIGLFLARHLGREFMPPLDEGGILDMPVTVPRASVTQAADDLKYRDSLIRALPEIELVVGKAGRADTPTDPAPLDMVETVINLRPREDWLKRMIRRKDAIAESSLAARVLEARGVLAPFSKAGARDSYLDAAARRALERYDSAMRLEVARRQNQFDHELAAQSASMLLGQLIQRINERSAWKNKPLDLKSLDSITSPTSLDSTTSPTSLTSLASLRTAFAPRFMHQPQVYDVEPFMHAAIEALDAAGELGPGHGDLFAPSQTEKENWRLRLRSLAGFQSEDFHESALRALMEFRAKRRGEWVRRQNQSLFPFAMKIYAAAQIEALKEEAMMLGIWKSEAEEKAGGAEAILMPLNQDMPNRLFLWPKTKAEIVRELDSALKVPGWANIWTQPIINRVDMLATGVRTQVGVKVYAANLQQLQELSNQIAELLRGIPGAADVVADQMVGKGYVEIEIERERAARYGVKIGDVQDTIEVALGGKAITTTIEGRERFPVRLRYARDFRVDEESIRKILISTSPSGSGGAMEKDGTAKDGAGLKDSPASNDGAANVYLGDVASIRVVEGPVMIKSENGMLRSYVQLNVRERDTMSFVEEAQSLTASRIRFPAGCFIEWTGQFEHQIRARNTLRIVLPAVFLIIFIILYLTYHDWTHAFLMMLAAPGALAGGIMFQSLLGYPFSVAVWVGYIACFGMATETGIIMLVYLRDAIAERGGLAGIVSLEALEEAILSGAVHRLRPKLLTEGTAILGLAPMLWATGAGAEVIAPMAAPVLGGLLIADEVIDIFLPVLFYQAEARRWRKLHGGKPEGRLPQ